MAYNNAAGFITILKKVCQSKIKSEDSKWTLKASTRSEGVNFAKIGVFCECICNVTTASMQLKDCSLVDNGSIF